MIYSDVRTVTDARIFIITKISVLNILCKLQKLYKYLKSFGGMFYSLNQNYVPLLVKMKKKTFYRIYILICSLKDIIRIILPNFCERLEEIFYYLIPNYIDDD